MALLDRIKHAWNAFMNRDPTPSRYYYSNITSYRPDKVRHSFESERTILMSVMNRIALDVANISIKHVQLDEKERYDHVIKSGVNSCLNLAANNDQTGRDFIKDIVMSMFDEGVVAIVPTDTSDNPNTTDSYEILEMRTAKILEWRPYDILVDIYNENKGRRENLRVMKKNVAICENPFYEVMNEPNSTFKRLTRKLSLLDSIDEQSGAGKLDLIIQLPYSIKSEGRRQQAEERKKDIEMQLAGSKYGIAYIDATEHVTQLNRSVDNNLMHQIEYLTTQLYSQLGITEEIMNGTADEAAKLSYENRILVPILDSIVGAFNWKFLTKTARTRGQIFMYFRDPFKLVPVSQMAELADKFTRNEIMSSNEVRQIVGLAPVKDPKADELRNSNLNAGNDQQFANTKESTQAISEEIQNGA